MEMGTGKTRTALELIHKRYEAGKLDKVLWFCPCSVKENLRKDLDRHADDWLNLISMCGIESMSTSVRINSQMYGMITDKTMLIVDESNLVKNFNALRTKHIQRLADRCKYRMILNGTPISRSYADLFSQWMLLDWRVLGYKSFYSFAANHVIWDKRVRGRIDHCVNVDYLGEKIEPYAFQVRKKDVLDLPDKTENCIYFDLTKAQCDHYWSVSEQLLTDLDEQKPATIYRLFSALLAITSGLRVVFEKNDHFRTEPFFKDPLDNPRLQELKDLLERLEGKAIIYCRYLNDVHEILELLGDTAVSFCGEDSQKKRAGNLKKFEENTKYLVAMQGSAGYGLNLQFCSNLIYYSNDWNLAVRKQSEDRVHRIGQTHEVQIYDLCADNTLDLRVIACLRKKESMLQDFKALLKSTRDFKAWLKGKE